MLMKFYQIMFILLLISGTLIAITSSSWFISWLGLELNLMMMIPLIISQFNSNSTESSIKYFLVQAMASLIFILMSTVAIFNVKNSFITEMNFMFIMALMMKSGTPPFHFWFPQVIELSHWLQCFIILTWQKIAPFILVSFIFNKIMYIYILSSAIIGSMGGFNQNSIKKILTYSSIVHSAWMLSIIVFNKEIWFKYFVIYSLISLAIIFMMIFSGLNNVKKMMIFNSNKMMKVSFLFMVLSLGGLPPFLGFLAKFMAASSLIINSFSWMILFALICSSLISLFFYCKMIYISLMTFSMKINYCAMPNFNKKISIMWAYASIILNLIIPSLVLLT